MNFKKWHQKRLTYIPKDNLEKHKHNYSIYCILEITNINSTAICYNEKEYYNVLKCSMCNSFISVKEEGNFSGKIFNEKYDKSLPLIKANTNMKSPIYNFDNLIDVIIK